MPKVGWIALLLLCGGTAEAAPLSSEPYIHPQRLVAVEGARRLNLYCLGHGTPVVLFNSGAADNILSWQLVQPEVAKLTRACAYDRAGLGFSDASPHPSDAVSTVEDIHRLLRAAGLSTPVLYVGHSLAGLYGVLLKARYPRDVAGEVLVDPSYAGRWRDMFAVLPPDVVKRLRQDEDDFLTAAKRCAALARKGALANPQTKEQKACLEFGDRPRLTLDDAEKRTMAKQATEAKLIEAMGSEIAGWRAGGVDEREMEGVKPDFGDEPLIVLTHEKMKPYLMTEAQRQATYKTWVAGHDRLARLSYRGSNTVVPRSDHYIQMTRPDAVIAAIRQALADIRRTDKKAN